MRKVFFLTTALLTSILTNFTANAADHSSAEGLKFGADPNTLNMPASGLTSPIRNDRIGSMLAMAKRLREQTLRMRGYTLTQERYEEIQPQLDECEATLSGDASEQEIQANDLFLRELEIELGIAEYAKVRKIWITPSTKDIRYSLYYDRFRKKIEQDGTCNFPKKNGKKLYGKLILTIPIAHDGKIYMKDGGARIERSSGNEDLDAAALNIVKKSEPFDPIPIELRTPDKVDVWEIITTFNFRRENSPGDKIECNRSTH